MRLAEEAHIKIYLAKERCGGEFESVHMGFGGLSVEEILEGYYISIVPSKHITPLFHTF